jgi:hypothetical protein
MPQFGARWRKKGYLPFGTLGVCPIVVVLYIPRSAITSCIRRKFHYNWVSVYVHSGLLAKKADFKRGYRPNKYEEGKGGRVGG